MSRRLTYMIVRIGFAAVLLTALAACSSEPSAPGLPPDAEDAFSVGLTENQESALLTFDSDTELFESRGVGWHLEEWNGTSWERRWILAGGAFTIDEWVDGDYDIGDVAVSGAGPDVLSLPAIVPEASYRICHGLDSSVATAGCGTLPSEPTAPNSAATTSPEPTTTIAIDG